MKSFEEQIRELQDERHKRERAESEFKKKRGEYIYAQYCGWCNAEDKPEWKRDGVKFGKYLKENCITLWFLAKKSLAEKYFGYKYMWNGVKWEVTHDNR